MENQTATLRELRTIPGVGKSIALDLWHLGYRSVADLRGEDPQAMYDRFCQLTGGPVDRCMLYVMRCAVYFAESEVPNPALLQWWNWSDANLAKAEHE